ncbi:MAG: undecaprenyl-diphosphate phosphatase [Deltaproteobacteria bacterium]|nr:undecaprenyl-diphosphate phosphatase [Deltaproteobacteria bacterium]
MTVFEATILGVLQGLGEFLPISSSGHLIVVPWMLGWAEHSLAFDVALHLGTLVAVLAAFAGDWWRLLTGFAKGARHLRPLETPDGRLLCLLALATVPGAVIGKLLEEKAESAFRAPLVVAGAMAAMGLLLLIVDRRSAGTKAIGAVSVTDALLVGLAQGAAIVPGVSRSGSTITMALWLGFRRDEAARFSFLLATPITLGAAILKVPSLMRAPLEAPLVAGMGAAAVVGFVSIRLLLVMVRSKSYAPFAYYRLVFALAVVALSWARLTNQGA